MKGCRMSEIRKSLIAVMKILEQPTKDVKAHKHKYANLENVILAIKHAIIGSESDLWFTQSTTTSNDETICKTIIFNSKGDQEEFISSLVSKSNNPQESGSAKSYIKRYSLCEIFAISPKDADDDGEAFMARKKDYKKQPIKENVEKQKPKPTEDEEKDMLVGDIVRLLNNEKIDSDAFWLHIKAPNGMLKLCDLEKLKLYKKMLEMKINAK